ncbi:MAG TPA: ATP-dependent Clp protease adaptor ClpS [Thermoanaerobaculia bacterium]|nr:ATP-dependent Clp protease adaptor ClpS [Thermoanaerobaculia bacterium]
MAEDRRHPGDGADGAVLAQRRVRTRSPRMFRVILHNDDYTTMEFVVAILESCFQRTRADAVRIMLQVHHRGAGVAGIYPREVAETKVAEVTEAAARAGMPLLATAEPDEDGDEGGGSEDGDRPGGP